MPKTGNVERRSLFFAIGATLLLAFSLYVMSLFFHRSMVLRGEFSGHDFGLFRPVYKDFLEENQGNFPPMNSTPAFLAAIGKHPALHKSPQELEALFVDVAWEKPYYLNGWLHGKSLKTVPHPEKIVALYQEAFDSKYSEKTYGIVAWYERFFSGESSRFFRSVLYADGHSSIIEESEWPAIKQQSHIP